VTGTVDVGTFATGAAVVLVGAALLRTVASGSAVDATVPGGAVLVIVTLMTRGSGVFVICMTTTVGGIPLQAANPMNNAVLPINHDNRFINR